MNNTNNANNTHNPVEKTVDQSGLPIFKFKRCYSRKNNLYEIVEQTDFSRVNRDNVDMLDLVIYRNWLSRKGIKQECKNDFVTTCRVYGYVNRRFSRLMYLNYEAGSGGFDKAKRAIRDNVNRYSLDVGNSKAWIKGTSKTIKHSIQAVKDKVPDCLWFTACIKNKSGNNEIGIHAVSLLITSSCKEVVLFEMVFMGDIIERYTPVLSDASAVSCRVAGKRKNQRVQRELINSYSFTRLEIARVTASDLDQLEVDDFDDW